MYKFHTDNQFPKLLVLYVATSAKDLKKARTLAKYSINVGGILSSSSVPTCVSGFKKTFTFRRVLRFVKCEIANATVTHLTRIKSLTSNNERECAFCMRALQTRIST